ncbi:unnamed protein product [Aphanomyces euteiches]
MAKGPKSKKRHLEAPRNNASSSGLVVVNPALHRTVDKTNAPPPAKKQKPSKEAKPKSQAAAPSQPTEKGNGTYICSVCNIPVTKGAKDMHEQGKKHKRALAEGTKASEISNDKKEHKEKLGPIEYYQARDEEVLGALYCLVVMRKLSKVVVVLPNKSTKLSSPQTIAGAMKQLGYSAFAIHAKTSPNIRKLNAEKLNSSSGCILVTTEHLVAGLSLSPSVDLVYLHGNPHRGFALLSTEASPLSTWTPINIPKTLLQKAISRTNLAKNIFELQQEQPLDNDAQWIHKLANASGLGDEATPKKKAGLTPSQQKLQALSEKLFVLLAMPLESTASVNLNQMKQKLAAVGLVAQNAATGISVHNLRLSAQTQWLDTARGSSFGGEWDGSVRHGASKDKTSLLVRKTIKTDDPWSPNPEPSDPQEWGGLYGKACGHNEVVLQNLRPFFPQEVLNGRVCCRAKPAPGNDGYDGCLEYLQWKCRENKHVMTLWDAEYWIFISEMGEVSRLSKKCMVTKPLSLIKWLMANFRLQTIRCEGRIKPAIILSTLSYALVCGTTKTTQKLPLTARQCILQFITTGSPETWEQLDRFESK